MFKLHSHYKRAKRKEKKKVVTEIYKRNLGEIKRHHIINGLNSLTLHNNHHHGLAGGGGYTFPYLGGGGGGDFL